MPKCLIGDSHKTYYGIFFGGISLNFSAIWQLRTAPHAFSAPAARRTKRLFAEMTSRARQFIERAPAG
jgi:hypothetical protein